MVGSFRNDGTSIPFITALFLPISKLDSKIVEAQGFNFPIYEKNSPYDQHQFLEPDDPYVYRNNQ
ncbi:DUF1980 domain-containing protein [Priestia flexa]|uniref:DUF1980 domain-containing protein n=1 Tax=Priestia flexa TaxID=86664 RepID=A0ABU4J236_9BACI|nr:DUF1980 domain-containing protein [Priestia flexa]MCA1201402.1 DUF1980 domain-containing protein [Priestia flexa]MCG7312792.1 DUF1980 domain-containing protein [Priestia flexa]MCM3065757.1 DUF1980 domain-containing protein [Priestia flexa]MCP1188902.1 DUF1980 domain-containing protein [Priestia flexa]MDW8515060.1 DUF1980 domain-containing protein [Priestia flexa]